MLRQMGAAAADDGYQKNHQENASFRRTRMLIRVADEATTDVGVAVGCWKHCLVKVCEICLLLFSCSVSN